MSTTEKTQTLIKALIADQANQALLEETSQFFIL